MRYRRLSNILQNFYRNPLGPGSSFESSKEEIYRQALLKLPTLVHKSLLGVRLIRLPYLNRHGERHI